MMLFNKMKKQNKFFLIILLSLFSFITFTNKNKIPIPRQLQINSYKSPTNKQPNKSTNARHNLNSSLKKYHNKKTKSKKNNQFAIPNKNNKYHQLTNKEKILSTNITAPYKFEKDQNYLSLSHSDIFKRVYDKDDTAISFTYLKDKFDIIDPKNIYQKTFDTGNNSLKTKYLLFTNNHYFYKNFVNLF